MERKFEIVTKYQNSGITLPRRATSCSAGYDICAAEDTVVPSLLTPSLLKYINTYYDRIYDDSDKLREIQDFVRTTVKPTLVPTGIKVKMPKDDCLMLYNRSSNPIKRNLVLANGVGIIDSDYYNNETNEGEIFGSFYNLSPRSYCIKKGERIMQGIFQQYMLTTDDNSSAARTGGFGSTNEEK